MKNILSPSILAADFSRLGEEIRAVESAGAEYLHIDVMDGLFVPSISLGCPLIRSIRKTSRMVFDVHLMIERPERYLKEFREAGADILTVHAEACTHLDRTIEEIHSLGAKAGIALNPATPLPVLEWVLPDVDMVLLMTVNPGFGGQVLIPYVKEKIKTLHRTVRERGLTVDIEVDGGIYRENIEDILQAGANVVVAGSAVFSGDPEENTRKLLECMKR